MSKGDWDTLWVKKLLVENIMEMRGRDHFGTVRASVEKMPEDATEETSAIY
jgi:hypothetical protein